MGQKCRAVAWGVGLLRVRWGWRRDLRSRAGCGTFLSGRLSGHQSIPIIRCAVLDMESEVERGSAWSRWTSVKVGTLEIDREDSVMATIVSFRSRTIGTEM